MPAAVAVAAVAVSVAVAVAVAVVVAAAGCCKKRFIYVEKGTVVRKMNKRESRSYRCSN